MYLKSKYLTKVNSVYFMVLCEKTAKTRNYIHLQTLSKEYKKCALGLS